MHLVLITEICFDSRSVYVSVQLVIFVHDSVY